MHNYQSNLLVFMTRCGTDLRHQYAVNRRRPNLIPRVSHLTTWGEQGENKVADVVLAKRHSAGSEKGQLFSQASFSLP